MVTLVAAVALWILDHLDWVRSQLTSAQIRHEVNFVTALVITRVIRLVSWGNTWVDTSFLQRFEISKALLTVCLALGRAARISTTCITEIINYILFDNSSTSCLIWVTVRRFFQPGYCGAINLVTCHARKSLHFWLTKCSWTGKLS